MRLKNNAFSIDFVQDPSQQDQPKSKQPLSCSQQNIDAPHAIQSHETVEQNPKPDTKTLEIQKLIRSHFLGAKLSQKNSSNCSEVQLKTIEIEKLIRDHLLSAMQQGTCQKSQTYSMSCDKDRLSIHMCKEQKDQFKKLAKNRSGSRKWFKITSMTKF